jgi:hypothetical protein
MAAIGFIVMTPEHYFCFQRQFAQRAEGCANAQPRMPMRLTYKMDSRILRTTHADLLMSYGFSETVHHQFHLSA